MSVVSRALVQEVIRHSETVREYILQVEHYDSYEPGQFLQLSLDLVDASGNWPESRTFSLASYQPNEKTIRLIIKREGPYTGRIFNELSVGTACTIKYAYGDFMLPMFDEEESIHCIAGGTGIAHFLSFMEYLNANDQIDRLYLYYSARQASELVHCNDIVQTLNHSNLQLYSTRESSESVRNRRMEINDVMQNVKNIEEEHFYICGSTDLVSYFKEELEKSGAVNIYTDEWS
jgi:ferredoxin-NADP reductase